ncbi:MAG: sulfotransferase family 2 domain-containing protein [Novosphingobium sp.]|uniref:sulfotransferase family 2 domain-containing protein n=1 Tax=Novosphingobium sp. TaxID=1874826 RepID=UPI003B9BD038
MIISHSRKFVLLAPWKTASQTCHETLAAFNDSKYERNFHFNQRLGRVVHQHVTLGDFLTLPEATLEYKLAAFVRNPYDRAYSGFIQIQRDFQLQPRMHISPLWVRDLVKAQIAENMTRVISAGFDFDEWIANLPEYEIFDSGRNTNMPLHPAHYWTHVQGKTVDFIGKVENFSSDLRKFCNFVGVDLPNIKLENLTEQNQHSPVAYSRYAGKMSRRSLDRINELFFADFDLFGYEKI